MGSIFNPPNTPVTVANGIAASNVAAVTSIATVPTASTLALLQGFNLTYNGVSFSLAVCVRQILCGLSFGTQKFLKNFVNAGIAQLEARKVLLEAKLIKLDILVYPIAAANALAQKALATAQNAVVENLIPVATLGQCFQIGSLTTSIQTTVDLISGDAQLIADDLIRLTSFGDEINAEINSIDAVVAYYQMIISTIDICSEVVAQLSND